MPRARLQPNIYAHHSPYLGAQNLLGCTEPEKSYYPIDNGGNREATQLGGARKD